MSYNKKFARNWDNIFPTETKETVPKAETPSKTVIQTPAAEPEPIKHSWVKSKSSIPTFQSLQEEITELRKRIEVLESQSNRD